MDLVTPPSEHPHASRLEGGTGVELATWVERLDAHGARDLDHTAIARHLVEEHGIDGWWAQGVTVADEQLIGRRVVGQSCEGTFSASASRTVPGDMDTVQAALDAFLTAERRAELGIGEGSLSSTPTWRYWRAAGDDGSRVSLNITAKDGAGESARSTLAVEHKGLDSAEARQVWKDAWTCTLDAFLADRKETR